MAALYNLSRGLRSRLNTLIGSSAIVPGREYLITDENRVAVGVTTTSVVDLAKRTDDYLELTNTAPGLPGAGIARIFRADVGGREMIRVVGDDGDFATMQPHMGRNAPAMLIPVQGIATPTLVGFPALTGLGTAAARSWDATSRFTRARRMGYTSGTTAGSMAGFYMATLTCSTGDTSSGAGGFHFIARFGVTDTGSTAKLFVGLANSVAAPGTGEVNTLLQHVGVGKMSTSSNLCMYCAGTAAQSVIDLGTGYPGSTASADLYELILFAPSSTTPIGWQLTRFLSNGTSTTTSGTFPAAGTAAPAATIGLTPRAYRTATAAAAVGLDIAGVYLETDL